VWRAGVLARGSLAETAGTPGRWFRVHHDLPDSAASERPDASIMARLSKSLDYLAENLHVFVLSKVKARVKGKVRGLWSRFQIGNLVPTLSVKDAEKGGAPGSSVKWRHLWPVATRLGNSEEGWAGPQDVS